MNLKLSKKIDSDLSVALKEANYLKDEIERRVKARTSFYDFAVQAWPIIERQYPYVDGMHVHVICEHLEALFRRDIRKLIVNIPYRMGKSSLCSILFPAWVWANEPEEKFLCASHSMPLSLDLSVKCRRFICSDWYQSRWGNKFSLLEDQNTKGRFDNSSGGYRIATSIESTITGFGGGIRILDDPNDTKDKSDTKRESANKFFSEVWVTRGTNPKRDVSLIIQQRYHNQDITGYVINNDVQKEWTHLILPMEFETNRPCTTVILPSTNGKPWFDPRTKENELLWPNYIDAERLKSMKIDLKNEYNIAGQLQQRPAPAEGGIIKKHWFKWWKESAPPAVKHVIQSWDTALKAGEENSYSACTTWGIFYERDEANLILLSMWRGRVEYPDLRVMAKRLYQDYRDDGSILGFVPDGTHVPDVVLIEDKASGPVLIQDFARAGITAFPFDPKKYGDKKQRVHLITHLLEAGRVWVPSRPPDYKSLRKFAEVMVDQCAVFPNDSDSKDLVDTMTQVLLRLKASGWITHPHDDNEADTSVRNEGQLSY